MALAVFGSGPGIGRNVAALFAGRGFNKVILLSRDTSRLHEDAQFVKSKAFNVDVGIVQIDLASLDNVRQALDEVDKHLQNVPLRAVLYNAARVGISKLWEFSPEDLESDLRISAVSLYAVAQWAMPLLASNESNASQKPAFFVTSGGLYKNPFPALFSLAASKAAQYNLVHSLYKEYSPQGVHCASIVVRGAVSDNAKVTTARNIAEETWKLYEQPKGSFALDVEIDDPDYIAAIKKREQEGKM